MGGVDISAPNFDISVAGTVLDQGIRQLIQSIEYESADGMADVLKMTLVNPEFVMNDVKALQPGNEVSVFMGYGTQLRHVGRAFIVRHEPNYPQDGMPTINVVGYTKDHKMMENEPEKSTLVRGKGGRKFADSKYSDAVTQRASDYGMELDIDETPEAPLNFIQKVGMSDYEFVRGLANLTGYLFWVDGDENGVWKLHFKNPETFVDQEVEYTFKYNLGDFTSLMSFDPEILLQGFQTKIKCLVKDVKTGRVMETEVTEENNAAPEVLVAGDPTEAITTEHTTGSDIKLLIGDFAFEAVANRRFKTEAEIVAWARQWFRRRRENFIMARARTIGVEALRARQFHNIEGVGKGLDGRYYFSKVRHIFSNSDGYFCDISLRKAVPPLG